MAEPFGQPGLPQAWNFLAAPQAADTIFLLKTTFVACVSFSPLPLLFI